jgi:hypothetical protein
MDMMLRAGYMNMRVQSARVLRRCPERLRCRLSKMGAVQLKSAAVIAQLNQLKYFHQITKCSAWLVHLQQISALALFPAVVL